MRRIIQTSFSAPTRFISAVVRTNKPNTTYLPACTSSAITAPAVESGLINALASIRTFASISNNNNNINSIAPTAIRIQRNNNNNNIKQYKQQQQQQIRSFFSYPGPKALDQIVNVRKLERDDPFTVATIWKDYHKLKLSTVAEVLNVNQWQVLDERSKQCPMFVLPIFKNIGFMTVVIQFQNPYVLITSHREFMKKAQNAPPYLTLTHFTDLLRTKGLVLVRGEVNFEHINKGEAVEFLELLYKFYLTDDLYNKFVEPFNKYPHLFNFQELLNAIQKIRPPKYEEKYIPKTFKD